MEEGKLKRKKISAETTVEILFFLFLLVFYLMWARVQPMGAGPDEQMRYQIADYLCLLVVQTENGYGKSLLGSQ